MLSVSREASNSRSLNGIISIEDGNGTVIEDGIIKANSIQVQQQLEIEGDLVCENLVASGDIECLDLVTSGDIGCENITVTTNLVSATASIGILTSNFLNLGELQVAYGNCSSNLQVGNISNVESEINGKLDTTVYNAGVIVLNTAINTKLPTSTYTAGLVTLNNSINLKLDTSVYNAGLIVLNTAINTKLPTSTYTAGISTLNTAISNRALLTGANNSFSNIKFFNKPTTFKSYVDDGNYYGAMVITNASSQPSSGSLCVISGDSGKTALNVEIGDVVIEDNLQVGSITDIEAEINLKLNTTVYDAEIITINNTLSGKAQRFGSQIFISSKDPSSDSFQFQDWQNRTNGALVKIVGTATKKALQITAGVLELGTLTDVEASINSAFTNIALKANIISPALSGTPTSTTALVSDNSTQIATTAYVKSNLDSPALTGTPTSPTPLSTDNSTAIATTAYVKSLVGSAGALQVTITSSSVTYANGATVWKFTGLPAWVAFSWTFNTNQSARTKVFKTNLGTSPPYTVGEIQGNNSFILMTGSGISQLYKAESSDLMTFCHGYPETYRLSSNGNASILSITTSLGGTKV